MCVCVCVHARMCTHSTIFTHLLNYSYNKLFFLSNDSIKTSTRHWGYRGRYGGAR